MNDRQRDLFLYQWSRRRGPGGARVALRGAVIGGLGGLAFAGILLGGGARLPGVHAYDMGGQLESALGLLAIAVPTFALLGWQNSRRIWRSHEGLYQRLLASGARVPIEKPTLGLGDRGPQIAVGITVLVIGGFIAYLFWAASTGNL